MVLKLKLAKSTFFITFFLTLAFIVSSCTLNSREESGIELPVPEGNYRLEEVLSEGELLLSNQDADVFAEYFVWQEGDITLLSLPNDPLCHTGTGYERPGMLPDKRLGFVKFCLKWPDRPVGQSAEYTLVAYDLVTGETEQVMQEALYSEDVIGNFTWNPDMIRGIISVGSLDGTLYWISPVGPEPMDITISEGRRSWSLADSLANMLSNELDNSHQVRTGIADEPAWSPDGQTIAFMASPKAIDYNDFRRANTPYNLYFMSPDTLEPVKMLENIRSNNLLKWSPESDWLLMDGCMGLIQKCGLWVFQPGEERLELVATGDFWGADWMSNHEIATSYCIEKDIVCKEYKLMQYDISEIVNR